MQQEKIKISRIIKKFNSQQSEGDHYVVCFLRKPLTLKIDDCLHKNMVKNTAVLIKPYQKWKIENENNVLAGYVLYLSKSIMENPVLRNLGIAQAVLDHTAQAPVATRAPNTARRIHYSRNA